MLERRPRGVQRYLAWTILGAIPLETSQRANVVALQVPHT